jgi:hypothetical protein
MFAKQINNGRELPKRLWHLPSLKDELYNGKISKNAWNDIEPRKVVVDTREEPPVSVPTKYGEVSRQLVLLVDLANSQYGSQKIASAYQVAGSNGKRWYEIKEWFIETNAKYIAMLPIQYILEEPSKLPQAEAYYNKLMDKWGIDKDFDRDVLREVYKVKNAKALKEQEKERLKPIIESELVPIFNNWESYPSEDSWLLAVNNKIKSLGLEGNEAFIELFGGTNLFKSLDPFKNRLPYTDSLSLVKDHISVRLRSRGKDNLIPHSHMTKWGPSFESEDDWED